MPNELKDPLAGDEFDVAQSVLRQGRLFDHGNVWNLVVVTNSSLTSMAELIRTHEDASLSAKMFLKL